MKDITNQMDTKDDQAVDNINVDDLVKEQKD